MAQESSLDRLARERRNMDTLFTFSGQRQGMVPMHRIFLQWTDDVHTALFINQLIYWHGRSTMGGAFAKTYADWWEEIGITMHGLRAATQWCCAQGFLTTEIKKFGGGRAVHYTLDLPTLSGKFAAFFDTRPLRPAEMASMGRASTNDPLNVTLDSLEGGRASTNNPRSQGRSKTNDPNPQGGCSPTNDGCMPANDGRSPANFPYTETPETPIEGESPLSPPAGPAVQAAPSAQGTRVRPTRAGRHLGSAPVPKPAEPRSLPCTTGEVCSAPPPNQALTVLAPTHAVVSGSRSAVPEGFAEFWAAYPRKVGKDTALAAWRKLAPAFDLQAEILTAIAFWRTHRDWCKEGGQFIPHPTTWINQGRWTDERTIDIAASVPDHQKSGLQKAQERSARMFSQVHPQASQVYLAPGSPLA